MGVGMNQGFLKVNRFDLLVSIYIFCICVAELMGAKTFPLLTLGSFKLSASVAIFVIPILFTINDVIVEVHGKERARSVIRSGLFVIFLLFLASLIFISLPPSGRFAGSEQAYDTVFGTSIRIMVSSLIAFTIAEFTDVFVFVWIRKKLGSQALWFRNNVSNFVAEFFDTVIFMTLAFSALDKSFGYNAVFLIGLILPYWLLKCFMSVIETPFVYWGIKWLKKTPA